MSTEEDMRHVDMLLQQSGSNLGTPHRVGTTGGGGSAPTIDYSTTGTGGYVDHHHPSYGAPPSGGRNVGSSYPPAAVDLPIGTNAGVDNYDLIGSGAGGGRPLGGGEHFDMSPVPGEEDGYPSGGGGYSSSGGAVEYHQGADNLSGDHGDLNNNSSRGGGDASSPHIPGYDRMQRWVKRKEQRMNDLHNAKDQKHKDECTFQPATYTPTRGLSSYDRAWGFDEAVNRVREGRVRKQEKKDYERKFWANESRWTGESTVPEPFELTDDRNRRMQISSLKKTYDQVAHAVRHQHGHDASEIEPTSVPSGLFSCKTSQSIMELSPDRYQGRSRFASASQHQQIQSGRTDSQLAIDQQQYSHRSLGGDASNLVATPGRYGAYGGGDTTPGSAGGGVIVISAEERRAKAQAAAAGGNKTPHTSRSVGHSNYSPPSSHRSKYGVSPSALTPHRQLPL